VAAGVGEDLVEVSDVSGGDVRRRGRRGKPGARGTEAGGSGILAKVFHDEIAVGGDADAGAEAVHAG
jgi:hypothetical protein